MRRNFCAALACAIAILVSGQTMAGGLILKDAVKTAGNATAINIVAGGLVEGVAAYTDRTHVLVNIPDELEGSDLLQVSNSDKSSVPYNLNIKTGLGLIYVGIDDRAPVQPLPWMNDTGYTGLPDGFIDTGAQIDIDEDNNGSVNQSFSLWVALAGPGSYNLGEMNFSGNNYIVAGSFTLVPEPSSIALACCGGLGLLGLVRRRG